MPVSKFSKSQNNLRIALVRIYSCMKLADKNKTADHYAFSTRKGAYVSSVLSKQNITELKDFIRSPEKSKVINFRLGEKSFYALVLKEQNELNSLLLMFYPFCDIFVNHPHLSDIDKIICAKSDYLLKAVSSDASCDIFSNHSLSTNNIQDILNLSSCFPKVVFTADKSVSMLLDKLSTMKYSTKSLFSFYPAEIMLSRVKYINFPYFAVCFSELMTLVAHISDCPKVKVFFKLSDSCLQTDFIIEKPHKKSTELLLSVEITKFIFNLITLSLSVSKNQDNSILISCKFPYETQKIPLLRQTFKSLETELELDLFGDSLDGILSSV